MDADQVLAFRLARSGLVARAARGLGEAAACPASDFARDAALLALAARAEALSREAYRDAIDTGELVVAHIVRAAIHALAPGDLALYGRALLARDDGELATRLGRQVKRLAAEKGFAPSEALDEVASATKYALANGAARQERAACGAPRTRECRPDALVPRLRQPPRSSDAVALRHGGGRRPARLGAPLHERRARADAGGERGHSPLLGFCGPA